VHPGLRAPAHYNEGMLGLRYAYVLALVVWLGGMVLLGTVVAPTTFGVLQAQNPADGRALAGAVFGSTLARFHWIACGAAGVLLVSLSLIAIIGPRPAAFGRRIAIIVAMLVLSLYSGLKVGPRVEALRTQSLVLPSALPSGDARRVEFDRLHQLSTWLMTITMAGGLVLLYWEAQE